VRLDNVRPACTDVDPPEKPTLLAPPDDAFFDAGPIGFSARASDAGSGVARVDYYARLESDRGRRRRGDRRRHRRVPPGRAGGRAVFDGR
jgi:hypothetical protein